MNRERFGGVWKQCRGKLKEHWCKLADDQSGVLASRREQLAGRIQEQYGVSKEKSELQLRSFLKRNRNWYLSNR